MTTPSVTFETSPDQYKHWKLTVDGNNPLKFARTPEQALAQLLNPPERGFMNADQAIEDAFRDLQAHQMAKNTIR